MSNKDKIVVAIVTFYPNLETLRFKLACQTIGNAIANGHKVVVVDGSPQKGIIEETFEGLGALVFREKFVKDIHSGLGTAKRQSLFHAMEIANQCNLAGVLADEAEKDFSPFIPTLLAKLDSSRDVVVPARTRAGWESYPEQQIQTEGEANATFCQVTGLAIDIMFGPVLIGVNAMRHFILQNPSKLGFPNTYAQHLGVLQKILLDADGRDEVHGCEVDFLYPPEQRAEEEGDKTVEQKRINQRDTLSAGYRSVAKILNVE